MPKQKENKQKNTNVGSKGLCIVPSSPQKAEEIPHINGALKEPLHATMHTTAILSHMLQMGHVVIHLSYTIQVHVNHVEVSRSNNEGSGMWFGSSHGRQIGAAGKVIICSQCHWMF